MAGEKTGSSPHRLAPLQLELLESFFAEEQGFFLTGGAALVGFYLHHRTTSDLDLFTGDPEAWQRSRHVVGRVVAQLGARLETKQDAPDFQRHLVTRPPDAVVLDLVFDRVPSLFAQKTERNGIRLDPPEEILVNKLTTLVSRAEERDLVDVMFLERAGYRVEDALAGALTKDGGCTPGQLAFVLAEITVLPTAALPGAVDPDDLRTYLQDLIRRLRKAALPPR
jgi:hypothetical protein